ncbi:MAG: hypothetical protein J6K23_06615 [Bacilli bacterium]|nr:hypothetical protein [Bacilli bacterium]MBP3445589.1 hypothetical protein [Bacilli bacterium]
MENNGKRYKKNIENIDKIKELWADEIIKDIRKNEINFSDIALNLGITNEELASILIQPDKSTGSEVMLVADNVKKKVNK